MQPTLTKASGRSFSANLTLYPTIVDTTEQHNDPLKAVGLFVIEAERGALGVIDGAGGISVTLPTFKIEPGQRSSTFVSTTLKSTRAGGLVWTGQAPYRVGTSEVEWRTPLAPTYEQPTVLSQGADPGAAYIDQRLSFAAGILAGLAGGALLAAGELALDELRARRGQAGAE